MTNIILSGGSGTRLWPLSRKLLPKQFLELFNNKTLFQLTIERNSKICDKCMVISNIDQYFIALDQLEELDNKFKVDNTKFLLEEIGKNTAPAIAFAALESSPDEILFVTPSDHLIKNEEKYLQAIEKAKEFADKDFLVTFGIKPTEPNTGYGYIEANNYDVIKFHEKPDFQTAKEYVKKGNYYWNSGMFMFKAGKFLAELKKHNSKLFEEILKSYEKRQKISENQLRLREMNNIPDISVDYAVMEKSDKIKIISSKFEWNDVGSFDSLVNEIESKDYIGIDSKDNFIYSNKMVATIDIEDLIVIDTDDALLITKKGSTQKVKKIVEKLKNLNHTTISNHTIVHRPWGTFETLIEDNGYKIKRIIVKPGKRLSLQKHFHRNEHWIVVSGTAEVTVGENIYLVRPNESTYIKMGEVHRLSNPGKVPVILIEAQVGEYTGEDDIIRIEDDFKRQ
ncbi:mannose-1-phosphate guanylyltransferase/mannose-6-phosphate isomerase [Hydrogenimonas thermophila]|uniref:mannose-1-phosphate guanylyltransferase/mannose-6-phosphate isomerase n=1 Tax=Hydrogenimonas thermophila TaxID=223786 RepID=UPI002936DA0C|nr:mannose-1-phosphate guanylyltransferase/mannose-6-phosphate isomerase [Hydrogenimonas thermophila]WOE69449.1 mannose-1-phosphate guanylyltransferase/mannose-6-phosphate isomerase [Hydrogenimonas thermophila]WOE71959.1 mannose-1-phosphate guanylyltransferase/mannose-6-phosphate isomerase [Hydrogenimonas thermophila]